VPGGEGNGFVEEKQLGPGARLRNRSSPAAKVQQAGDPSLERPLAVGHLALTVDQNAPVSGKGSAPGMGDDFARG
jgi:hypothetical protein